MSQHFFSDCKVDDLLALDQALRSGREVCVTITNINRIERAATMLKNLAAKHNTKITLLRGQRSNLKRFELATFGAFDETHIDEFKPDSNFDILYVFAPFFEFVFEGSVVSKRFLDFVAGKKVVWPMGYNTAHGSVEDRIASISRISDVASIVLINNFGSFRGGEGGKCRSEDTIVDKLMVSSGLLHLRQAGLDDAKKFVFDQLIKVVPVNEQPIEIFGSFDEIYANEPEQLMQYVKSLGSRLDNSIVIKISGNVRTPSIEITDGEQYFIVNNFEPREVELFVENDVVKFAPTYLRTNIRAFVDLNHTSILDLMRKS